MVGLVLACRISFRQGSIFQVVWCLVGFAIVDRSHWETANLSSTPLLGCQYGQEGVLFWFVLIWMAWRWFPAWGSSMASRSHAIATWEVEDAFVGAVVLIRRPALRAERV